MALVRSGSRPTSNRGPAVVSQAGSVDPRPGRRDDDPVAVPDHVSGPATVIVGRESELARLRTLRDAAFSGLPGTVLIAGEAGVGKTSVTNAFVAATLAADPRVRVVRGECVPLGGDGLPYAPVVGLLHDLAELFGEEELLRRAGAGSAELRWLIPEFGAADRPVDGTRPENRLRLFETILRLVEDAARQAPLIIVVEDLHWADESSRHVIDFLVRAITGVPVLIMISYRTDELTRRHPLRPFLAEIGRVPTVHRIEIGPLSSAAVEQLITISRADSDPDDPGRPELIKRVAMASGGIPYFVVELIRAGRTGGELPETLRDTLLLRISRVGEDCQRLLRLLAVGGNRVEHTMIAAVSDLPPAQLEQALREATEAALIVPDKSGYAFRHALMREVLLDDLLPGELTRMHRAYVVALDHHPELMADPVRVVELAHHSYAARDNQSAFRWSVEAARLQRYGYAEALRHYERALELWEVVDDPELIAGPLPEFLDEASEAAIDSGDVERSLAMINEALRVAGPHSDPEATALRLARKAQRMMNLVQPGVLELVEKAVALVPSDRPTAFRARLLNYRAAMQLLLDKPASVASARETIEVARLAGAPDIESSAHNTLGCALATLGIDPAGGLAELRLAGDLAVEDQTRIRYHVNLSDTLTLLGRYQEAVDVAMQGWDLAVEVGRERHIGIMMTSNAAEALLSQGQWRRARQLVEHSPWVSPASSHWIQHRRLLALVAIWMDDDLGRAQQLLGDLEHYTGIATNGPQYHFGIRLAQAELAVARNEPAIAWQIIRATVTAQHWAEPHYDLALLTIGAAAYGRDPARPGEWADWLRDRLQSQPDFPSAAQSVPYIRAELDNTVQSWSTAVGQMQQAGAPPHLIAVAHLRLARLQAADGLPAEARRNADQARALAQRMGLRLVLRWVDELGSIASPGPGRAGDPGPASLTERERQVLSLVAQGLSNRQIGERLVISTKTASVHVSNILAKLAVRSRGEAAARFRSQLS